MGTGNTIRSDSHNGQDLGGRFPYNPARSGARVQLIEAADPDNYIEFAVNPTSFSASGGQTVAQLQPVGWSSPIIQSGFTVGERYSITCYFSELLAKMSPVYGGVVSPSIEYTIAWIEGAVYPKEHWQAPPLLVFVWPRVRVKTVALISWKTDRNMFNRDMTTAIATMELEMVEVRQRFKTWDDHLANEGFGLGGDTYTADIDFGPGSSVPSQDGVDLGDHSE